MQNPLQPPLQNMQAAIAALTPVLLAKMGTQAVNYSKENFRRQSFAGVPWAPRKYNKKDTGRAILVKSGHLRNAIRIVSINPASVTIGVSNIPYARAHNEGFNAPVTVTSKKTGKTHTRNMKIPQRQYLGITQELKQDLRIIVSQTIAKALRVP